MDRRKYYLNQLVAPADLNAGETNTYNAIGNLMSDIGIFGIISGGDITEQAAPSMSVDMTTPFIGYDQDGERIYKATGDVIDCSVDYLGNPTVPSVGGESVWISIHGRFAYTEEDPKVIKGDTKYLTWKESYEWRVVVGVPAPAPGHAKPAKPADALLITDIELINGQVTILNADIDESRKDSFVFTNAAGITVAAGGWTKLDAAAVTVQDALDSADNELISRDGAGEVDEDILPVTGAHKLGQAGSVWNEIHAATVEIYTELIASVNGKALGSVAARFEGFFNTIKLYTKLEANATGVDLGDAAARFDAFLESIQYHGAVVGSFLFDAAKSVTVRVSPDQAMHDGSWTWSAGGAWTTSAAPQTLYWEIKPPHGVVLQSARIRWYQVTSTTMVARLASVDEDGAETLLGAGVTIGGSGANRWDTIDTTLAETIDRETKTYRCKIASVTSEVNRAFFLELTYDITDVLMAALTGG